MMRDSGQPLIWQLDSYSLDHCFATSFYPDIQQWQEAQDTWESVRQGVEQAGTTTSPRQAKSDNESSVWQRSHTNMHFFEDMPALEACAVMMFSIGGHMAELIHDLKACDDSLDLCRDLHEAFDDLRVVFKDQEDDWMIRSAAGAFTEVLEHVASRHTDLAAKCKDLENKLDFFCCRYAEHNDPYSPSDQP